MIQKESYLVVADNSGAKLLQCIHVIGSTGRRFAYIGDTIKCSVKKAIPGSAVKKGDVVRAVIVRTRKEVRRLSGMYIRFDDNAAVLLNSSGAIIATRIFGPVAGVELRVRGYLSIVSRAMEAL